MFLMLDIAPQTTSTWKDIIIILASTTVMGIGGGIYNSVRMGAGARDGIMLAISVKSGASIRKVRIITEMGVLLIGWIIGGSIFQYVYLSLKTSLIKLGKIYRNKSLILFSFHIDT